LFFDTLIGDSKGKKPECQRCKSFISFHANAIETYYEWEKYSALSEE